MVGGLVWLGKHKVLGSNALMDEAKIFIIHRIDEDFW